MWSATGHRRVLEGILQEVGLSGLPSKMPAAWPQQGSIFKSYCCGVMCSHVHAPESFFVFGCILRSKIKETQPLSPIRLDIESNMFRVRSRRTATVHWYRCGASAPAVRLPPMPVQLHLSYFLYIPPNHSLYLVALCDRRDTTLFSYKSGYRIGYVTCTKQTRAATVHWYRCGESAPSASAIQFVARSICFQESFWLLFYGWNQDIAFSRRTFCVDCLFAPLGEERGFTYLWLR